MLKATIPAEAINLNERSLSIGHLSPRALRNWRSFHFLVLTNPAVMEASHCNFPCSFAGGQRRDDDNDDDGDWI